ncbi:MAG: alpha/beta fold hydrolase [Jatrophihabitantaceae bacterium]
MRTEASRHEYGTHPAQFGELYRPAGPATRRGTVVVLHGGFWRARYDLSLGRPLAHDLCSRGYTVWNLEYRRVGIGGGWPETYDDVAAGIDLLAHLDVDTTAVTAIGHSAGGQLAVWAAGRSGAGVEITAVVSQAGVLDLTTAATTGVGRTAVPDLLGGLPSDVPDRYAATDPIGRLPLRATVLCLHARADNEVPFAQSTAFVESATSTGGTAYLQQTSGDHYSLIDPASTDWAVVLDALPELLRS